MIRLVLALLALGCAVRAAPASAQTAGGRRGARGRTSSASGSTAIWALPARRSPAVRSEVAQINIRRRALYNRFAASRGVSPQEVGITAGCQLLARVAVGQAYMLADGAWRRRAASQPAPVPDYCR